MLNYRLIINRVEIELSSDVVIQLEKSSFDVGDIANKIDYSNNIDIDLTPNNLKAFEFINDVNSLSNLGKLKLKSDLYCNDVAVYTNGFAMINSVSKGKINIYLISELKNFYELINRPLQELDCNDLNLDWTPLNISLNNTNTEPISFLICETNTETLADTIHRSELKVIADLTHPSMRSDEIVERIITQAGYTADLTEWDDIIKDTYIYLSNTEVKNTSNLISKWGAVAQRFNGLHIGASQPIQFSNIYQGGGNLDNYGGQVLFYRVRYAGTYRVSIKGRVFKRDGTPGLHSISAATNSGVTQIYSSNDDIYEINNTIDIDLTSNTYNWFIQLIFSRTNENEVYHLYDFECTIEPVGAVKILFNSNFKIQAGLPEMSQLEFMKSIAQLSFLAIDINEADKIVRLRKLANIISNINNTKNLSKNFIKLKSIKYKFGKWSQENKFLYDSDKYSEGVNGLGVMTINNQQLPTSVEFFKNKLCASAEVVRMAPNNYIFAFIPIYENGTYKNKVKPRILYPVKYDKPIALTNRIYVSYGYVIEEFFAGIFEPLSYDNLLLLNIDAISYAYNLRLIEVEAFMTELEFKQMNNYSLIYFDQLQSWFFLNKISGYTPEKSCILETIKIL